MTEPVAPAGRATDRFYVPELDGLRFVAFLMVFAHHGLPQSDELWGAFVRSPELGRWLGAAMRAGGLGVDVFFVLSSYLITELLVREHALTDTIHVREFYVRRCLRIWPLYFVFLGGMAVLHVVEGDRGALPAFPAFALFAGNWWCAFRGYPHSPIAPLWSVSIEEQFYILWPLLLAFITPRRLVAAAVGMLVTATLARAIIAADNLAPPAMWCITFSRLDPIAMGILAVTFARRLRPRGPWVRAGLLLAGGLLLVTLTRFSTIDGGWAGLIVYPLAGVGASLPLLAIMGQGSPGWSPLSWAPIVFLGRISYGLYVFHELALKLAARAWDNRFGRPLAALVLDVALAVASYFVLEKAFLKLKARFTFVQSRPGG